MTLEEQIPIITRTKYVRDSEWDSALKPAPGCLISRHGWSNAPQLASAVTIISLKAVMERSVLQPSKRGVQEKH